MAISEPERLTQRESKRPFEGFVCIAWLSRGVRCRDYVVVLLLVEYE